MEEKSGRKIRRRRAPVRLKQGQGEERYDGECTGTGSLVLQLASCCGAALLALPGSGAAGGHQAPRHAAA